MSNEITARSDPDQPAIYKSGSRATWARHWADWFEGLAITLEDNGETRITGVVTDQAALHLIAPKSAESKEYHCSRLFACNPQKKPLRWQRADERPSQSERGENTMNAQLGAMIEPRDPAARPGARLT